MLAFLSACHVFARDMTGRIQSCSKASHLTINCCRVLPRPYSAAYYSAARGICSILLLTSGRLFDIKIIFSPSAWPLCRWLLFKPHYLLRHRNPRLLLVFCFTLAITLTLNWLSIFSLLCCCVGAPCEMGCRRSSLPRDDGVLMTAGSSYTAYHLMGHMPWYRFYCANIMLMLMYVARAGF